MSDPGLRLPIESSLNDTGFRQTEAWLKKLQALQKAPPAAGGGIDKAAAQAAVAQQRLEAATQRTAAAQGRAAVEAQRLATEEQRTAQAMAQAAAASSRAELSALRLAQAQAKAAQQAGQASNAATRYAQDFGKAFQSNLIGIVGPAAAAAVAIRGLQSAGELIQLGAQANQTRQAFNGLAQQAGTTGDTILNALRKASAGTISDLNLQLAANRANLLGVADSAQELSVLMDIARDRAQKMGITTNQAFSDLVVGLGRGSALILDNLGITVSVTEANKAYAASLGKTVAQLSEAEQKQALINAVLTQGQTSIAATGGAMQTMASDVERFAASWDNLKASIGEGLAALLGPAVAGANELIAVGDNLQQASEQALAGADSFGQYGEQIAFVNEQLTGIASIDALTEQQFAFAKSLMGSGASAGEALAKVQELAPAFQQLSAIQDTASVTSQEAAAALQELAPQIIQVASTSPAMADGVLTMAAAMASGELSVENFRTALAGLIMHHEAGAQAAALDRIEQEQLTRSSGDATQAISQESTALAEQTAKALDAQIQAQKLAEFQRDLARLGGAVAAGHMAAGDAALILANKYNIARDAAANLINMQAQIAGAQVRAARQGGLSLSEQREGRGELQNAQARYEQVKASAAAAEAERRYQMAIGNTAPELAHLRGELAKTTKGSAEYFDIQTKIAQLQHRGGGGGGRGGRGGGAGTKLDTLRTQEMQKTEDAELQHRKRLLDIEEDYNKKSLAQARENEIAKRASRADFYDKLTQSTKDIGGDVAQELSAEYEKAFAQAREMEQQGNFQQAEDFRKAKQKQLDEELDYQRAVAEVRKSEDMTADEKAAETARLTAIHQLRQDELNEQLKQATEGGDAINQAKQQALDEENRRFEEQTGKIAETADRKAAAIAKGYTAQSSAARQWASDMEAASERVRRAMESVPNAPGGGPAASPANAGTVAPAGGGPPPAPAPAGQGLRAGQQSRGGAPNGQPGNTPGTGSGGGAGNVGNAGQALIEANAVIMAIIQAGTVDKRTLSQLERYQDTIATATAILSRIADLRAQLQAPASPIPAALIQQLAFEAQQVAAIVAGTITTAALRSKDAITKWSEISEKTIALIKGVADLRRTLADSSPPLTGPLVLKLAQEAQGIVTLVLSTLLPATEQQNKALRLYADAASAAIDPLSDVADLRESLAEPQPPLTGAQVLKLAQEAQGVLYLVEGVMLPTSEATAEGMQRYADAATAALGVLAAVADLRESAAALGPPLTRAIVEKLALEAQGVLYLVSQQTLPITEETAQALQRYADAASAALGLLSDVVALRKALAEPTSPIAVADIQPLAVEAAEVLRILEASLVPTSEDQAEAVGRYADAASAALSLFGDVADLRESMANLSAPLRAEDLERLADEGRRAYEVLIGRVLPTSEEQAEAVQQYADTVGAAVEALTAPLDLSGKLFADYVSPSDAQLDLLARDANRVAERMLAAAAIYDTKGLEAGKAYAEGIGAMFGAFNDGLVFFDRLRFSDLSVDPANLALFEQGVGMALDSAARLGALAATIPAGNIAALNSATGALGQAADTMIRLAAVPFGNLAGAIGNLGTGGGGGGGQSVIVNIYNPPATMDTARVAQQLVPLVKQHLNRDSQGRRAV
jgi:hypothetical protein